MRRRVDLSGESGIALTVAICSLALMITLGGIALNQAVFSLRKSTEQEDVKAALQAADAAVEAAAFAASGLDLGEGLDLDELNPGTVLQQNCVVTVSGDVNGIPLPEPEYDILALDPLTQTDTVGRKWCPTSGSESVTSTSSFDFRLSQLLRAGAGPCGTTSVVSLDRDVVGVGRSGDTVRRVKAHLKANLALLSGAAVQASSPTSPLALTGTAQILGDARSNANITGTITNKVVGNATPGYGKTVSAGLVVVGSKASACNGFTIPEVAQGDAPTLNKNATITERCANLTPSCVQPIVGRTGRVTYTPATRSLLVEGNGVALLTGDVYSFCSVVLKGNGVLQVANSSPVTRIFLDDPANCPGVTGPGTITVSEQAGIVNCHLQTAPETLQIYAVGNATTATTQTLASSGLASIRGTLCGVSLATVVGEPMTIVAPHSTVALGGTTKVSGQIAADRVTMSGSSQVSPVNALVNLDRLGGRPVLPLYEATDYVECTGRDFADLPLAEPAQGC